MRRLVLAGVVLIALALMGCGKSEKTVYKGPGGRVSVEKKAGGGEAQTTNVETKEGKASVTTGENRTITEAELGAPVYPGAKVEMEADYQGNKSAGAESVQQHMLTTTDDFDKVVAYYKSHLKNVSGEQNMSQGDTKMSMFAIGKKDEAEMMVQVVWDAKKKQTTIHVMKQGE